MQIFLTFVSEPDKTYSTFLKSILKTKHAKNMTNGFKNISGRNWVNVLVSREFFVGILKCRDLKLPMTMFCREN
jgi:hypothetical protein